MTTYKQDVLHSLDLAAEAIDKARSYFQAGGIVDNAMYEMVLDIQRYAAGVEASDADRYS